MSTHTGMWQRDPIQTTTQRRREGKVDQHPATAARLADGGSPHDPLPVAATAEKGAGRATVAAAGPRRVRRSHVAAAVLALVVLAMAAYGVTRVLALGGIPDLPSWAVPFALGVLVGGRISFRAGQYARGYGHARGIRRSHWASIQGRGH